MKPLITLIFAIFLPAMALTQEATSIADVPLQPIDSAPAAGLVIIDASTVRLDDLKWEKRPVVVFADTPEDPSFQLQMKRITDRPEALYDRDVVVITDTDPTAKSDVRLRLRPRGFSLVLMDKDGAVMIRKPLPWDVREISRAIDKMPMRREELLERNPAGR